jgi:hypothetical protein
LTGSLGLKAGWGPLAVSAARAEGNRHAVSAVAPPSNEVFKKSLREVEQ